MKSFLIGLLTGLVFLIIFSCNSSIKSNRFSTNNPIALFFVPDSLSMEKMVKEMDTASFADYLEDNQTYYSEAQKVLEDTDVKTETTDARYLEFIKKDGTKYVVNVDTMEDKWGLFLFDGINNPQEYSMTDMVPAIDAFYDLIK